MRLHGRSALNFVEITNVQTIQRRGEGPICTDSNPLPLYLAPGAAWRERESPCIIR